MKVEVDGRVADVRELSIAEIRTWFNDWISFGKQIQSGTKEVDALGELLFQGIALRELGYMTNLSAQQIESLSPSAMAKLIEAIKEVNPDWYQVRTMMKAMGEKALAENPQLRNALTAN